MKIIFFICCFILSFFASAQRGNINLISEYEDTLKILAERIVYEELEENRRVANDAFITHLDEVLQYEKSFDYNFDSLKTISVINSPDNQFRIFTWMLRKSNGTYEYYGRVQLKKKRGSKTGIYMVHIKKHTLKYLIYSKKFYHSFCNHSQKRN